jgi:Flp pilus assembly protein TadG
LKRVHTHFERSNERGVVITLVAVFMLFVVGAMAVLAIDVVTFYTARSEAQLAADGAALAGARVLANSGMTSSTDATLASNAAALCSTVATQVARSNQIGGQTPTTANVTVTCNTTTQYNPTVSVQVQANVPTFFARIWGSTQVKVSAKAKAEAYNPSGLSSGPGNAAIPVATTCVKPWLLPNLDPSNTSTGPNDEIFDPTSGQIMPTGLLGWQTANVRRPAAGTYLTVACPGGNCGTLPQPTTPLAYYPGDPTTSFPPPSAASVTCSGSGGFTNPNYQLSVAGCMQTPISCNQQNVTIDTTPDANRNYETAVAVNCLTNTTFAGGGDSVDEVTYPGPYYYPFEFLSGADNPVVQSGALAADTDMFVSDSLVTVPVFNIPGTMTNQVNVIGFLQLFLNPEGQETRLFGGGQYEVHATVVNIVGCGTGASGTPVYGNGPSAVPVRLITPP